MMADHRGPGVTPVKSQPGPMVPWPMAHLILLQLPRKASDRDWRYWVLGTWRLGQPGT